MRILQKEYHGDSLYLRIANEDCLQSDIPSFFYDLGFPSDESLKADLWYGDFDEDDFEISSTKYQAFMLVTKRYVHLFIVIKTGVKNEIDAVVREVMTNPKWGKPE